MVKLSVSNKVTLHPLPHMLSNAKNGVKRDLAALPAGETMFSQFWGQCLDGLF